MRGRRKSTNRSDWWDSTFNVANANWPVVIEPHRRPNASIFDLPDLQNWALQRSELEAIKQPGDAGILHAVRASLSAATSDAPQISGPLPREPSDPGEEPTDVPEPRPTDFPVLPGPTGFFETIKDVLSGRSAQREANAKAKYERELRDWKANRRTRDRAEQNYRDQKEKYDREAPAFRAKKAELDAELLSAQQRYDAYALAFKQAQSADQTHLDSILARASENDAEAIQATTVLIVTALSSQIRMLLARDVQAFFEPSDGILLVTFVTANAEEMGMQVPLKTKLRPANAREVRAAQEFIIQALSLRLCHEVYAAPELYGIKLIGINTRLEYTDRHNGQRKNEIIGSIAVTRDEFSGIQISEVDAKLCFRSLKGHTTPSFDDLSAVRPVLTFDTDDKRIVEARNVVDGLHEDTNLAAMDWEDFEHVVRELFAKMFTSRNESAEVHVTRASRDYGVDALIHDPDPIHGGKFVIQAKRYVNTVDVAAVRDLFGTVQNEGANRGYLVTTSSFGPDAYSFAKGKPITLIDGPHLLKLLQDHGYAFRINLQEARATLHGN